ncbi:MAG: TerB family tellurite resistance protein [Azospirillaceae bacterium]
MSIWGKIVGGAAGFALGGPIGALVGAAAGHAVDRLAGTGAAEPEGPESRENTKKIAFTIGVVALGAKMAKADGVVTRDEVDAFKRVFRIPPEEEANVARVFNMARRDSAGFEVYAKQIAELFEDGHPVLEELLTCLMQIARADGTIHDAELAYLRQVATIFGLSETDFARLRAAELGPDAGDPYTILGVPHDADEETIKAAYRRLVRENHPDRLIAQGMPQEFVDVANEKLATINAAYDRLRGARAPAGDGTP